MSKLTNAIATYIPSPQTGGSSDIYPVIIVSWTNRDLQKLNAYMTPFLCYHTFMFILYSVYTSTLWYCLPQKYHVPYLYHDEVFPKHPTTTVKHFYCDLRGQIKGTARTVTSCNVRSILYEQY